MSAAVKFASVPIAEVMSPSQLCTFLDCSARGMYRYVLKLPENQGSQLAVGKALHATVRDNFLHKIDTKADLPLASVLALYRDAWTEEEKVTEFRRDEDRSELKAMGAALVAKYHEAVAPTIEPAAVEFPVSGVIGGVKVRGIVDLRDVHGKVIDLKSANRSPGELVRFNHRMQVASYVDLMPGANGTARVDTVVKNVKRVKLVSQDFEMTPADQRALQVLYPLVQDTARTGLYTPNRNSLLCSRRYCNFWRACTADFGGEIKP